MHWTLYPSSTLAGEFRVPGDKSLSHRLALISLFVTGKNRIRGYLDSEDCRATLAAVKQLGADVETDAGDLVITGVGGRLQNPKQPIDCGNSGTGMRLLTGLLAGLPVRAELTGDASLRSRPMDRVIAPLLKMGARVTSRDGTGRAPLRVEGGGLRGIDYALPVASAQVKSCLLLAGLSAAGETILREPAPTRDHTERLLRVLGMPIEVAGLRIRLRGAQGTLPRIPGRRFEVPGDFSSAAFWLTAAAGMPGARVTVRDVGINPRRTALLGVLRTMGADVRTKAPENDEGAGKGEASVGWEPRADITVRGGARFRAFEVGGAIIPNLIDEIPALCAAAALARGDSVIRDAAELRVKESDRIAAMAEVLERFGVAVDVFRDGLRIRGGRRPLRGGERIDCRGDHRIAMAAGLLALAADAPTRVDGVECVDTSYPGFLDDLRRVTASGAEASDRDAAPWRSAGTREDGMADPKNLER